MASALSQSGQPFVTYWRPMTKGVAAFRVYSVMIKIIGRSPLRLNMNSRFKLVVVTSSTFLVVLLLLGAVMGQSASPEEPYRQLSVYSEVLSTDQE